MNHAQDARATIKLHYYGGAEIILRAKLIEVVITVRLGKRAINISYLRDGNQAYIAAKFMPKANFHASPSLT